jgi:selenocysteine lyase/cysteine desulfurase
MLSCQKHLFALPDDLHYLNNAYMSPLATAVEEAGIAGMRRKRVPVTITSADFFTESDALRRRFAELLHTPDWQRVAIIPSVSYGMATVARNLHLGRGQQVVVAGEQFPSNVYPWHRLAEEAGARLHPVPPPEAVEGRGKGWNERLLEAIDAHTALVALPHIHWTDGTRFDLEAIGRRAREVGAAFVVDGTQSVGAMPFDLARIQPDALVCAGYKWLLGPYGLGLAWFGPRFDGGVPLEEGWITRAGSEHFDRLVAYADGYQPGAVRYDMGERSNFILVPMLEAALGLVMAWEPARIQAYTQALAAAVWTEAQALGFEVEDTAWRGHHLVGVRVPPPLSMAALRQALAARQVAVSGRGNAVRISLYVYNDARDLAALHDAFQACVYGESVTTVSSPG